MASESSSGAVSPRSCESPRSMDTPSRGASNASSARPRQWSMDSPRSMERAESKTSKRRSVTLSAKFLKSKSNINDTEESQASFKDRTQKFTKRLLKSTYISNFMVAVVLFDAYCTCRDIDARAIAERPPQAFQIASDICLILYTMELFLNLFVKGWSTLKDWTLLLDVVIIACGYADLLLNLVANSDFVVRIGMFRAFRLARIVRLMRLLRRTRALRELQKLVTMMATCLKALLWSFVFCFLIMSVWAMFIVEVVHPLIIDPDSPLKFPEECGDYCTTATGSVMDANLLLFKTVIAGDSWGQLAVPVIQKYPFTAIIFVGSLLTLVFGVLNLIVAVVVDTFAEARQRDILNLAEELEYDYEKDRKFLQRVFDRMDADGSGLVTFEELVEGARRDHQFQSRLRVMDIDEADLQQLFDMIDTNEQGYINAAEFIAPLSRWVHDSKTAPRFIKYNLQRTMHQQEELFIFCQDCFNALANRLDELSERIDTGPLPSRLSRGGSRASGHSNSRASEDSEVKSCGSFASDGSQLDPRPVVAVMEDREEVEQPHESKKVKVSMPEADDLSLAMESLERFVLNATESALKKSMTIMGHSIRKRLGNGFTFTAKERSRTTELPKKHFYGKVARGSSSEAYSSMSNSWAMGGVSKSISMSSAVRSHSKDRSQSKEAAKARRLIGGFGAPRPRTASQEEMMVAAKQATLSHTKAPRRSSDMHRSQSF